MSDALPEPKITQYVIVAFVGDNDDYVTALTDTLCDLAGNTHEAMYGEPGDGEVGFCMIERLDRQSFGGVAARARRGAIEDLKDRREPVPWFS